MIQSLSSFTVTADYGRAHTTYNVHVDGQQTPVARMHKDTVYSSPSEYRVYTDPGLDQLVGYVTDFSAKLADRTPLGKAETRNRALRDVEWTVIQNGLGELIGKSAGVSTKLRRDSRLGNLLAVPASEFAFTTRLHFRSPESAGFELTRLRGVRARYAATIHDDRVNRLLILACVAHYAEHHAQDIRQPLAEMTANPFKR
ncbi:hypothetical protein SRB17_04890 [Streptomyces sp. RB17]|uniref:hypothetical protein n=1 Tax=Streptomyces sp. RB17 TaxID=2585197 RepID=UPI0012948CB5|nr:hypothetical protein [Streptomyces sp. RB17]MQY32538.1 hypothetical protein [Streptomyces sp. RB17]